MTDKTPNASAPIRILFTIPNLETAGSGREMVNIIERLDRAQFQPAVGVLRRGGQLETDLERIGVPVFAAIFSVQLRPMLTFPFRFLRAARAFPLGQYDLWHSFHWSSDYTEPAIARLHGAKWMYTKKNMNWERLAWIARTLLSWRVIARNREMVSRFLDSPLFRKKVRLVHGGVDTEAFAPGRNAGDLRKDLGTPPEKTVVVSVAQLVAQKGQDFLVGAIAQIPEAELWLVGEAASSEYASMLNDWIAKLGVEARVRLLGKSKDIRQALASANIFVLATSLIDGHEEGCPVSLLEAMAMGMPCIATRVAGSRDIIEDGVSGLLVDPESPDALCAAIERIMKSPELAANLGRNARQRVTSHFTLDREASEMAAVYAELRAG